MSIATQVKRIKTNIANSYTALEDKGAELPTNRNSNNLAETILSIPAKTGGGITSLFKHHKTLTSKLMDLTTVITKEIINDN